MAESENLKLQLRSSFQYGWQQMEQTTQECEHAGKLHQQIGNFNNYILHRVFDWQRYIKKSMADVFVSKTHHGGSVALRTGDVLVVELPEIFSTGFRWAFSADPQGAVTTAADEFTPN